MSEPTKGQIEEAYKLAKEFVATHAREVSPLMLFPDEIANLIAHVRKRALDDALEGRRSWRAAITTTTPIWRQQSAQ